MSSAVGPSRAGSWSSRPPSVGSSRRSSLSVAVAKLKSEFPVLMPGFPPPTAPRDTVTLPNVPEWGFYLGVDQSVKKLDLSPPDRPNKIEVMVYCGEDAIVRTFSTKKTLRDVYIWVRSTLTHAKIPPRLVLTSGGVQYPASGPGADTRLADLPNIFEIQGTVQPPPEDEDDKLKVRVRAGMDTLVGKFNPKEAFKALYSWVRATLAFKKRPRAFVLKSGGETYALNEENVEKMMLEFPDEFELVELKTRDIPSARLKRREAAEDEPRTRLPDLDPRHPAPPPPSRDRSPHPENRNLKTGLETSLRKRPRTRKKDRDKPKETHDRQEDKRSEATDEDNEVDHESSKGAESEGADDDAQYSSRAPPPPPRLLSRDKDDRKKGSKRRESTIPDPRANRDKKNQKQDTRKPGTGDPDYLFDVGERLRGGNFCPPSGFQLTIPSVHGLVSRFELPMDLRELDTLTPRQYLTKYCKLNKTRQLVYREVFDKQDWRHTGNIVFKDVLKAVHELYERDASPARLQLILGLLEVDTDSGFDRELFCQVCALYDRFLLKEHTAQIEGVVQTEKERLENADFTALDWKLHDRDISGPLSALLHAL